MITLPLNATSELLVAALLVYHVAIHSALFHRGYTQRSRDKRCIHELTL